MKGGKSKYYLNGSNATNEKIKQIFQSVQLNVNNPHFLIMQGKVTQVARMKPKELLSLLEETAGTSLYEGKKKVAEGTIEKKEKKLEEIEMVSGPIQEKIEKQKIEKELLAKYRTNGEQLGKIRRILVAHKFYELMKITADQRNHLKELEQRKVTNLEEGTKTDQKLGMIAKELEEEKQKQSASLKSDFEKVEQELAKIQKEYDNIVADLTTKEKEMEQESNDLNSKNSEIQEFSTMKETKLKEKEELKILISRYETDVQQKIEYIQALENQSNKAGDNNSLAPMTDRINFLEKSIAQRKEELNLKANKCEMLQKQKEELAERLSKAQNGMKDLGLTKEKLMKELEKLSKEIESQLLDDTLQRKLAEEGEFKRKHHDLQDAMSNLNAKFRLEANVMDYTLFCFSINTQTQILIGEECMAE